MIYLLLPFFLFTQNAGAHVAEFFGAGATTMAVGNQASFDTNDGALGYYSAALLAHQEKLSLSFSTIHIKTKFEDINNIVVENSTNSNTPTPVRSSVGTDYEAVTMGSFAAVLPLAYEGSGNLVLNVFTPIGNVLETNSGDEFLPEYVMYRARYNRTSASLSYAQPLSDRWAFSLGTVLGFQVASDIGTQASLNGTPYGSSAKAKTKAKPTLSALASLAYQTPRSQFYLSYQQEVKSSLRAVANGEINDPTSALFSLSLESMMYFDPHIFRVGYGQKFGGAFTLLLSADYQMWENYQTPVIRIRDQGGVLKPSDNYEVVTTENIFVPRLGLQYVFLNHWTLSAGGFYRPTPLKGDFSGSGNSIDTDVTAYSLGLEYRFEFFSHPVVLSSAVQYQQLKDKQVIKSPGQENGSAGDKIGAPGYKIGGEVVIAALGLNFLF